MSEPSTVLYLRVPTKVHADLRRIAEHNGRTVAATARDLLLVGLDYLDEQRSIASATIEAPPRRRR